MKSYKVNCVLLIFFAIFYCTSGCNPPANASVEPNKNTDITQDIKEGPFSTETLFKNDTAPKEPDTEPGADEDESSSILNNNIISRTPAPTNDISPEDRLEQIMKKLSKTTKQLKSYSCILRHLYTQPMFETDTLRIGKLYYQKYNKGSKLLVRIDSIQQDDEKPLKQKEEYFFDGYWLTQIEHETKQVKRFELANTDDPNGPLDAFELMSQNFPIMGFTNTQSLRKDFDITIVGNGQPDNNNPSENRNNSDQGVIELKMRVKKESKYAEDYSNFDFHIDQKTYLPKRIIALTTDDDDETIDDFYTIDFIKPDVNKRISDGTFKIKIPRSYNVQTKFLEGK